MIELTEVLDELYTRLSESTCSVELIDDLEKLIWLYQRREELYPETFQGFEYLTFMQLYAKLGYLYELSGDLEKGLSFYEIAIQFGSSDPDFFDLDYIKEIPFNSRMGCEIKED